MDDPFIRQYVEDLLTKIRTQVRHTVLCWRNQQSRISTLWLQPRRLALPTPGCVQMQDQFPWHYGLHSSVACTSA